MRKTRLALGLTMKVAAERAGITEGYWSQIEANKATPSLAVAGAIAAVLGKKPEELFHELRSPSTKQAEHQSA